MLLEWFRQSVIFSAVLISLCPWLVLVALMVRIIAGILDNFRRCKGLVRRSWCFSGGIVILNSAMATADVYSNLAGEILVAVDWKW